MLLVYLLFFLLHLSSSSVCHATSRNHRLFLHTAAIVPAASPSTAFGDHRTAMMQHVWRSPDEYVQAAATAMEKQQGWSPPTGDAEGVAMAPLPPAADGGCIGNDSGGGQGGSSSVSGDGGEGGQQDGAVDDAGVDYAPPKTHPPSHN